MIRVYSTPKCVQCKLTKNKAQDLGLVFEEVDLSQSPDDMAAVKELGYAQAPVVIANVDGEDLHWSGFRPDMLTEIAIRLGLKEPSARTA